MSLSRNGIGEVKELVNTISELGVALELVEKSIEFVDELVPVGVGNDPLIRIHFILDVIRSFILKSLNSSNSRYLPTQT